MSIILFNTVVAAAFMQLFPDDVSMRQMVETLSMPAMQAIVGPIYGPSVNMLYASEHVAMVFAQEMLVFMMLASVIMNIFLINRHTRADEELGRIEMIRSLPAGRLTVSVSALVFAFGLNIFISVLTALAMLLINIAGTTVAGAFIYSFAIGAVGFLFACITLLTAQVFQNARSASAWAFALLGIFYGVRAYADMSGEIIFNYISPLGLGLHVHAFHANRIMPLIILFIQGLILAFISLVICAKRDLGEGVIPAKKGRRNASVFLKSPLGLAWRLSKGSVIAWVITMLALGATYGAVIGDIGGFVETNEMFNQLIVGGDEELAALLEYLAENPEAAEAFAEEANKKMADNFIAFIYLITALLATVPVITISGKINAEEKRGRLEGIFARSVSRPAMFCSYLLIAIVGGALFMICGALGIYAGTASSGLAEAGDLISASLTYIPSLLVMTGINVLLIGLAPKIKALIWAVFAYSFITVYFGKLLDLPEILPKMTPYGVIPQYTDIVSRNIDIKSIIILTAISAVLTVSGVLAFMRRDIKQ
ncbi:MAG: hypothetical protein FWH10_00280 [Oscillospiraceae bacterium]|nr:hypothetical protein [Oscillospiraceae bacterium]